MKTQAIQRGGLKLSISFLIVKTPTSCAQPFLSLSLSLSLSLCTFCECCNTNQTKQPLELICAKRNVFIYFSVVFYLFIFVIFQDFSRTFFKNSIFRGFFQAWILISKIQGLRKDMQTLGLFTKSIADQKVEKKCW